MFTNHNKHGGLFRKEFEKNLDQSKNVLIATGFFGTNTILKYQKKLIKIAEKGTCKILFGMYSRKPVNKKTRDILISLDKKLRLKNKNNGIFLSIENYHGKIYHFNNFGKKENIYLGSSNLSDQGLEDQFEATIKVLDNFTKNKIKSYLKDVFTPPFSVALSKNPKNLRTKESEFKKLQRLNKETKTFEIKKNLFPSKKIVGSAIIKIRPEEQTKSSLNLFNGKGRLNTKTGTISLRPWYEIEITSLKKERNKFYPIGNFNAYISIMGKYYLLPMKSCAADNKLIECRKSRVVFGKIIKGALIDKGSLKEPELVTRDVLDDYGTDEIKLHKLSNKEYILEF